MKKKVLFEYKIHITDNTLLIFHIVQSDVIFSDGYAPEFPFLIQNNVILFHSQPGKRIKSYLIKPGQIVCLWEPYKKAFGKKEPYILSNPFEYYEKVSFSTDTKAREVARVNFSKRSNHLNYSKMGGTVSLFWIYF